MAFITMNYQSASMARSVKLNVFLPFDGNLAQKTAPFQTLYFLPGYSASATDISTAINLTEQSLYKGIAIVVPDGDNSFYMDRPEWNAYYSKLIGEELVEVTRKLFPLSDKREDTFIGGISMGGFGAMMLGMRYKETFSKIMAMSPALGLNKVLEFPGFPPGLFNHLFENEKNYFDNYDPTTQFIKAKQSNEEIPDLFVCCGKQDELIYEPTVNFVNQLKENGVLVQYEEEDGLHDIVYWNKALGSGVDFLLKEEE